VSIGTIWNHRDFIKREYGEEDAVEFEQIIRNYQAEQISIERERIIKLLEDQRAWLVQHNNEGDNFIKAFAFQDAIALIKGENK